MTVNVANQTPYLRTSREFPEDLKLLAVEVNRSYIDIATAVNNRTIGIFATNRPIITGDSWFFSSQRQQSLRRVYQFTNTTNIPHGINVSQVSRFTSMYGTFTDGTNWYGLIDGSNVAIAGQISFYVDPTDIIFLTGAGAPTLTNGTIVLEWLSQP